MAKEISGAAGSASRQADWLDGRFRDCLESSMLIATLDIVKIATHNHYSTVVSAANRVLILHEYTKYFLGLIPRKYL